MIGRVIYQADADLILNGKIKQPFDELSSSTVVFRSIVGIDSDCMGVKPGLKAGPKIFQRIYHEVSGNSATGKIQIGFVKGRQENTKGLQYRVRMKIMITGFNRLTAVSAPGKRADVHVCLGVDGDADHPFGFIGDSVGCIDI